jgi:hypothetical protein
VVAVYQNACGFDTQRDSISIRLAQVHDGVVESAVVRVGEPRPRL